MEPRSNQRRRRSKPLREQSFSISKFGEHVVLCARGIKPADWLARRARCTERHANLIISGKRKPNARAALAVYADIIA
jgi:hypothetical protein